MITRGKQTYPFFTILYGTPGVGKTTLAAKAQDAIFLDLEDGTALMDVARYSLRDETPLKDALNDIYAAGPNTLVIDSLTSLERIHADQYCREKGWQTLESMDYGRSKKMWKQDFMKFLGDLARVFREASVNVILIAHSKTREVTDPVSQLQFDRLELQCDKDLHPEIIAMADGCFLLKHKVLVKDEKAIGNGSRVLLTQDRPQFVAKSRWPIPFEVVDPDESLWASLQH